MNHNALKRWAAFVEKQRRAWKVPGVAVAVFTHDSVLFSKGLGRLRLDKPESVTPQTPFCIGSTTKAITALALAQLADEDKLDWDAPVRDYMPEFELHDATASNQMTARDLLTHRSGLPRHDTVWFGSEATRAEMMTQLKHLQPNKTFRQAYQYQNLMYMAAGYLLERITDQSWEEYIRERIFKPLGMTSSGFSFDGGLASPTRACGHNTINGKVRMLRWRPIHAAAPAGAITSTVEDMTAWVRANMTGSEGSKQRGAIISPQSLKTLHTPVIAVPDSDTFSELFYSSYALGWNVRNYRGHRMLTHGGLVNGYTTQVACLPDLGIGAIVMSNLSSTPLPQILVYNAFDRILEMDQVDWPSRFRKEKAKQRREEKRKNDERNRQRVKRTSPTLPLEAYCGEFRHPGYGVMIVERKGNHLRSIINNVESKWKHYHYDMFIVDELEYDSDYMAACSLDEKGRIGGIAINYEENADPIVFKRVD